MAEECSVLVVEDDDDVRDMMVELLEAGGYTALIARHGEEALAQLRAGQRPCIILLDLMMPVMDGWTFCDEVQKDPALAGIPRDQSWTLNGAEEGSIEGASYPQWRYSSRVGSVS